MHGLTSSWRIAGVFRRFAWNVKFAPQNAALGEGRESGAVGNEMALEAAVFPSRSLVRPCSVAPSRLFHPSAGRGLAGGAEKSFLLGGRSIVLSAQQLSLDAALHSSR